MNPEGKALAGNPVSRVLVQVPVTKEISGEAGWKSKGEALAGEKY